MTQPLEQMHIKTTVSSLHVDALFKKSHLLGASGFEGTRTKPYNKKEKKIPVGISEQNIFCAIFISSKMIFN